MGNHDDLANRILRLVTLDDATTADELFSVSTGEDVERGGCSSSATPRTSGSWRSESAVTDTTDITGDRIEPVHIQAEMHRSRLAMSVIVGRVLPASATGSSRVHRKILYGM